MYAAISAQVKNQQLLREYNGVGVDLTAFRVWDDLRRVGCEYQIEAKLSAMEQELERNNKMKLNYIFKEQPLSRFFIKEFVLKNESIKIENQRDVLEAFKVRSPRLWRQYLICKILEKQYAENEINKKSFEILRILGRGAFGNVNAAKLKRTGKLYAMKELDVVNIQRTESVNFVMDERDFLSEMNGEFVTNLKYSFVDRVNGKIYLIMDLMTGGDLAHHLSHDYQFEEDRSRFYAAQILLGLERLHKKGIIYRDLKLGNVLLDNKGYCKLTDLGLAIRKLPGHDVTEYAGTPGYIAPEVVLEEPYDITADFFSFGCVIFRLLTGARIFPGVTQEELDESVLDNEPKFVDDNDDEFPMSEEAKDLILKLVEKDPRKRLGVDGIESIKKHSWFAPLDFSEIIDRVIEPEFVPENDEIYAEAEHEIGRAKGEGLDYAVTEALYKRLEAEFPYLNRSALQEEIVFSLDKVVQKRKVKGDDLTEMLFDWPNQRMDRKMTMSLADEGPKEACADCQIM